jgi:CRISPR-associated endonuclease/helicase Cas3
MVESNKNVERYREIFRCATGPKGKPYPYQEHLATALAEQFPELLDVPTGLGKTVAAVLAWLFRRLFHQDVSVRSQTSRRLVYCLPTRVLVEQTYAEVVRWLDRLGILAGQLPAPVEDAAITPETIHQHQELNRKALWDDPVECRNLRWYRPSPETTEVPTCSLSCLPDSLSRIAVHLLMGGEETTDWALWPEREAILIGTQDMLLSRALNRGYAAARARWPTEFGLLNNDCLWVFDEVQLMSSGLATSLQLDAWRKSLELRTCADGFPHATKDPVVRPCRSLWMSATMARHWLGKAVDWKPYAETAWKGRERLQPSEDLADARIGGVDGLLHVRKDLNLEDYHIDRPKTKEGKVVPADAERITSEYIHHLADRVACEFQQTNGVTLVVLNTVERAKNLFEELRKRIDTGCLHLLHSRFRPMERHTWSEKRIVSRCNKAKRLIVSTQVLEAGVDLSAKVLFTELAPWASLVQRFGRCARYEGESGKIFWVDMDLGTEERRSDHFARPYDWAELVQARQTLNKELSGSASLDTLRKVKQCMEESQGTGSPEALLLPYEPRFVPRSKDLFDLFDTTPDLTGADIDIARFIRDGQELDVQVFWRDIADGESPPKCWKPVRDELCPVPFYRFKFKDQFKALRSAGGIWRWNYRTGWEPLNSDVRELIFPGQIFLLDRSCGGYDDTLGWTGNPADNSFRVLPQPARRIKSSEQDADEDAEDLSQSRWLSIVEHTRHVCAKLGDLIGEIELDQHMGPSAEMLRLAARWHDRGKAHESFQAKIYPDRLESEIAKKALARQPAAKAPEDAWRPALRRHARTTRNASSADDLNRDDSGARPAHSSEDRRRPGFRHELASALAILETLRRTQPDHDGLCWPDGLDKYSFGIQQPTVADLVSDTAALELARLTAEDLNLLLYLVAAHHGKVRMSLRSSPDDGRQDVVDPCPPEGRQARGVRDNDLLRDCRLPAAEFNNSQADFLAPAVSLSLEPMELGLSARYGPSWRERAQTLLGVFGPFRLAYLESLLRVADCRASSDEDTTAAIVAQEAISCR